MTSTTNDPSFEAIQSDFCRLCERQRQYFLELVKNGSTPLFTTDFSDDYVQFIEHLAPSLQAVHRCSTCRKFFKRFGSLVSVAPDTYELQSALWPGTGFPEVYRASIETLRNRVERAKITGVFVRTDPSWGGRESAGWPHFSVTMPEAGCHQSAVQSASQARAEKLEDFRTLTRALSEFSIDALRQAVRLLRSDKLYRSEKVLGSARWLLDLQERHFAAKGPARDRLLWLAVAQAPRGFCHPRASMIGTLLEDLQAQLPYDQVEARFRAKMHPLQYQRPQAAPTQGNVEHAEKLIAQMGLEPALRRRTACLADIESIWLPTGQSASSNKGGIFSQLLTKEKEPSTSKIALPSTTITWEKFRRTILPEATKIEYWADNTRRSYGSLVTASDPAAPPLLQWDHLGKRNPVNFYVYNGGSLPDDWHIRASSYCTVDAITLTPAMWGDEAAYSHHARGIMLLLHGASDRKQPGLCLFPEVLRAELRPIRATIEAYSKSKKLEAAPGPAAAGLLAQANGSWNIKLRVTTRDGVGEYFLDRWD